MLKEMIENAIKDIITGESSQENHTAKYAGRMIVVLEKGFIYYGDIEVVNEMIVGTNGGNIRYFSEPNGGLAHLCGNKPSEKTKLDPCKSWRAPLSQVKNAMDIQDGGI